MKTKRSAAQMRATGKAYTIRNLRALKALLWTMRIPDTISRNMIIELSPRQRVLVSEIEEKLEQIIEEFYPTETPPWKN